MKMLRLLAAVPWLLMATSCLPDGSIPDTLQTNCDPPDGASQQAVDYVEIIQLDEPTQLFKAQLVYVRKGEIVLAASGKDAQLQDFRKQSGTIAKRERTVTLLLPLASTADVVIKPPMPPMPTGQDKIWLRLANQTATEYARALGELDKNQPMPQP